MTVNNVNVAYGGESVNVFHRWRLQPTTDYPKHLSYKTDHFEALYEIPKSYPTKINHFIWDTFDHFSLKKNVNICSSPKFWELGSFLKGLLSSASCRTTGHKTCFIVSAIGFLSFHKGGFIIFPLNHTCLSTQWYMISFWHCIYYGLTLNQTTHSLKSLALFCLAYAYIVTFRKEKRSRIYRLRTPISTKQTQLCTRQIWK